MSAHAERFIVHLRALKENDRGALATLRHSLAFAPGAYPPAFPHVERFAGNAAHETDARRLALYTAAALYARHSEHRPDFSFASAFGELMRRRNSASIEQRFVALLGADAENVFDYLKQAISLLATEGIACDYARLLDDLSDWMHSHKHEQRDRLRQRWARDFYRALHVEAAIDSESTTAE